MQTSAISIPDTFLKAYCYQDTQGWLKAFRGLDESLRTDFQGVKKHN